MSWSEDLMMAAMSISNAKIISSYNEKPAKSNTEIELEKEKYEDEKNNVNSIAEIKTRMFWKGWTLLFLGVFLVLFAIIGIYEINPPIVLIIALMIIGIFCLKHGIKSLNNAKGKYKYIELIIVRNKNNIDEIAEILKEDKKVVLEDIINIVNEGYICNCYIENDKKIIIKNIGKGRNG